MNLKQAVGTKARLITTASSFQAPPSPSAPVGPTMSINSPSPSSSKAAAAAVATATATTTARNIDLLDFVKRHAATLTFPETVSEHRTRTGSSLNVL